MEIDGKNPDIIAPDINHQKKQIGNEEVERTQKQNPEDQENEEAFDQEEYKFKDQGLQTIKEVAEENEESEAMKQILKPPDYNNRSEEENGLNSQSSNASTSPKNNNRKRNYSSSSQASSSSDSFNSSYSSNSSSQISKDDKVPMNSKDNNKSNKRDNKALEKTSQKMNKILQESEVRSAIVPNLQGEKLKWNELSTCLIRGENYAKLMERLRSTKYLFYELAGYGYTDDKEEFANLYMLIKYRLDTLVEKTLGAIKIEDLITTATVKKLIEIENYLKRKVAPKVRETLNTAIMNAGEGPEDLQYFNSISRDENANYGSGFFNQLNGQIEEFRPHLVNFKRIWHNGLQTSEYLDCLVHAINAACGIEWFQCREQVIRMLYKKMGRGIDYVTNYKARFGLNINYLKEIVCDQKNVYSIKEIGSWNYIGKNGEDIADWSKEYFEKIFTESNFDAFIVLINYFVEGREWKHAFCVKKHKTKGLACIDSLLPKIYYSSSRQEAECWNLDIWLARQRQIAIYVLMPEIYHETRGKHRKTVQQQLQSKFDQISRIMTGKKYDRAQGMKNNRH